MWCSASLRTFMWNLIQAQRGNNGGCLWEGRWGGWGSRNSLSWYRGQWANRHTEHHHRRSLQLYKFLIAVKAQEASFQLFLWPTPQITKANMTRVVTEPRFLMGAISAAQKGPLREPQDPWLHQRIHCSKAFKHYWHLHLATFSKWKRTCVITNAPSLTGFSGFKTLILLF